MVTRAAYDVVGRDLVGVQHASSLHQLLQCVQGLLVEVVDALGLVWHDQGLLAHGVLRGHAGGAVAGVARLGLQAAQRKHETARAVAPVGSQRQHACYVKCGDYLTGAANFDLVAQAHAA